MTKKNLQNGFSLALTIAILGVVIAVSTVLCTFIVSQVYADKSYQKQTEKNFIVLQFEYDFVTYSFENFVAHLESKGIKETFEDEQSFLYKLESETVKVKKDYKQLWVYGNDEKNTLILYLMVDDSRKIIKKQT